MHGRQYMFDVRVRALGVVDLWVEVGGVVGGAGVDFSSAAGFSISSLIFTASAVRISPETVGSSAGFADSCGSEVFMSAVAIIPPGMVCSGAHVVGVGVG